MTNFPCIQCGKRVPPARRGGHADTCTTKCERQLIADCAGDMANEARADLEAAQQGERNADAAYYFAHGE